jgi:hypothetical protein
MSAAIIIAGSENPKSQEIFKPSRFSKGGDSPRIAA